MKIPYNQVHVNGVTLFAARAGQIHSFSLEDGSHISTWKHPDVEKVANAVKAVADAEMAEAEFETEIAPAEDDADEPPAKRQKTISDEDVSTTKEPEAVQQNTKESKRKGKKSKNRNKDNSKPGQEGRSKVSRTPDRPVLTHLTSSADGNHLLAISGHDKTIWVFEHDGEGNLTLLSQRAMPKRPSSTVISSDSQILCADKFGDVYSLPLILTGAPVASAPRPSAAKLRTKPAASELTVHSRKNLQALKAQQKQIEQETQNKATADAKTGAPSFELTLLLGHVSMLTDLVMGEKDGRRYIITADRDEHIRVSRHIPQAHVIEGFCLGHTEFVSAMTIPSTRGEVLISGGGDADIFVWDWSASRRLSKASILSLVQEISPETTKLAVSHLFSLVYPSESGNVTYVLAICEGIKAIFSWQLTEDNTLHHPGVIQLPGNPMHLCIAQADNATPKIIAAIDPGEDGAATSLNAYSLILENERLAVDTTSSFTGETTETDDLEASADEIKNLLYGIENLRKQPGECEEDGGDGPADADTQVETD